ncbi:MAG: LamG domain-containing protein [Burkholderiaceae bacterium]|nr:LamG domain-containing protein [Burkholderiaceae bacterium]
MLVAVVSFRGGTNNGVGSVPSGWTQVTAVNDSTQLGLRIYVKVAASEPASYSWSLSSSSRAAVAILAYRGVDTSNPVITSAAQVNGSSTSSTAPSITPGVANSMLVGFWSANHGNRDIAPPASMTTSTLSVNNSAGPNGLALAAASQAYAPAIATGTRVATIGAAQNSVGALLALRPGQVLTSFVVEATGGGSIGDQIVGSPFNVRITARNQSGATMTSFNGTATISSTGTLTQGVGTTASFVNGVLASHTVSISNTGNFTITATSGSASGTSDGFQVAALSAYLIADYRMDEPSWNGTADEVLDASSNARHGRGVNATTASVTPAIVGSPGTCGYGVFNRNNAYVELPTTFPNLRGSFTVAGWIRPTVDVNGDQRIFADDENGSGGIGFSLGDGGAGRLRFFSRSVSPVYFDSSSVINTNQWHFVAAVHDAATRTMRIHAFDAAGTSLGAWSQTYTGSFGADNGRASIGGETAGAGGEAVPQWRFGGNIDEMKFYSVALSQAQVADLIPTARTCFSASAPGGFNTFETSTASGAITGVIRTKVAGSAFNLALVALNTARTAVQTGFTGAVTVELLDASNNSGALNGTTNCRSSWSTIQTLSPNPIFTAANNGRVNVNVTQANAWREVRVRVTYTSGGTTVIGCSTDNFAIRPANFASLQASDSTDSTTGTARVLNNSSATSGVVHRAGRAFTVQASAVNAGGSVTTGYSGTPALGIASCALPGGCSAGTLSGSLTGASGTVAGSVTYSEAGVITVNLEDASFAAVDAADSSLAERTISTASAATFGRFVPDAYRLSWSASPTLAAALCAAGPGRQAIMFAGQNFGFGTAPAVLATPVNAAGAVLANARPRYAAAGAAASFAASGTTLPFTSSVTAASVAHAATSTVSFTGSNFRFERGNTPVASFVPTLALTVTLSDTTETGSAGNSAIVHEAPLTLSAVPFDGGTMRFHFGRLSLRPAYGDVRQALSVPLEVQSFNGTGWVALPDIGSCVLAGATDFAYTAPSGALAGAGGAFTCATRVTGTVVTSGGRTQIVLPRPGALDVAQPAAVTLRLNVGAAAGASCSGAAPVAATTSGLSWLAVQDAGGSYSADPAARVAWGRSQGTYLQLHERFD